jgi:hypothetical protein
MPTVHSHISDGKRMIEKQIVNVNVEEYFLEGFTTFLKQNPQIEPLTAILDDEKKVIFFALSIVASDFTFLKKWILSTEGNINVVDERDSLDLTLIISEVSEEKIREISQEEFNNAAEQLDTLHLRNTVNKVFFPQMSEGILLSRETVQGMLLSADAITLKKKFPRFNAEKFGEKAFQELKLVLQTILNNN